MVGISKRDGFLSSSLLLAFLLAKTLTFPSHNALFFLPSTVTVTMLWGRGDYIPHGGIMLDLV